MVWFFNLRRVSIAKLPQIWISSLGQVEHPDFFIIHKHHCWWYLEVCLWWRIGIDNLGIGWCTTRTGHCQLNTESTRIKVCVRRILSRRSASISKVPNICCPRSESIKRCIVDLNIQWWTTRWYQIEIRYRRNWCDCHRMYDAVGTVCIACNQHNIKRTNTSIGMSRALICGCGSISEFP